MTTSMTYLMADSQNGVQEIDLTYYPEAHIMDFYDFEQSLPGLDEDDVIFTVANPDQLEEMKTIYGVSR